MDGMRIPGKDRRQVLAPLAATPNRMSQTADQYCVMGNPIAHSRSPAIHARFAELTGERIGYQRRLVAPGGLARALRNFAAEGGRGCNITVPFKIEAARLADRRSDRVQLAGAANTLLFATDGACFADNTDGLGLVADITRNAGVALAGSDVLLIGAGGAAAGVLGPLLQTGARSVTLANRTLARAQELARAHEALARRHATQLQAQDLRSPLPDFDLVINASASSLAGAELPLPASVLRPGCLAYDLMYGAAAQGFLGWARSHGALARDGLGMLVEQAAESFALWRGLRPPSAQVLAEMQQCAAP